MLSPESIRFLSALVGQVTLSAAAPNFDELAADVSRAKRELAALTEATDEP